MTQHIFWAPHPDDETLGMGGHIARAAALPGPRPLVAFVFDALPSERQRWLFTGKKSCPWHGVRHELGTDLALARRAEGNRAAVALGADLMHADLPEQLVYTDPAAARERILELVHFFARSYPMAQHHFPAGPRDVHLGRGTWHVVHEALWQVGQGLKLLGARTVFHRIYAYSVPLAERPGVAVALTEAEMAVKRNAIAEYRRWDPARDQIAYGYHSVPELFDAAAADPTEYLEEP